MDTTVRKRLDQKLSKVESSSTVLGELSLLCMSNSAPDLLGLENEWGQVAY